MTISVPPSASNLQDRATTMFLAQLAQKASPLVLTLLWRVKSSPAASSWLSLHSPQLNSVASSLKGNKKKILNLSTQEFQPHNRLNIGCVITPSLAPMDETDYAVPWLMQQLAELSPCQRAMGTNTIKSQLLLPNC